MTKSPKRYLIWLTASLVVWVQHRLNRTHIHNARPPKPARLLIGQAWRVRPVNAGARKDSLMSVAAGYNATIGVAA